MDNDLETVVALLAASRIYTCEEDHRAATGIVTLLRDSQDGRFSADTVEKLRVIANNLIERSFAQH